VASRSIRFTKAHLDAVQVAVVDCGGLLGLNRLEALTDLLERMREASKPTENKLRVTPQDFAETLQDVMGDRVVVFEHPSTYIKLYSILKSEPFQDLAAVKELGESVLKWASTPISVLTLATKGAEWLSVHRARKVAAPAPAPVRKTMWDDQED
jgi:hypothetical protein